MDKNFYQIFDILCQTVIQKLKQNYDVTAFLWFENNIEFVRKGLKMKDEDPQKYEKLFGEQDLLEYFNSKCLTLFEKAKENHCYYFLTRLESITKDDELFEKFRNNKN